MPPEPWGWRLKRAREVMAGLRQDQAAALVGYWMLTSEATISRLEDVPAVPAGPRSKSRRQLAYVLCLCYEVDPAEFGLTPDDLPSGIRIPKRTRINGRVSSTKWYETLAA
jgi:hypothetical protein